MLLDLPEDVLRDVGLHLSAPDVLSLLCTQRRINNSLGKSKCFWKRLLDRDSCCDDSSNQEIIDKQDEAEVVKEAFLTRAYTSHLASVKWFPLRRSFDSAVSAREGHSTCVLGGNQRNNKRICVTGGFTDDDNLYVLETSRTGNWNWKTVSPAGHLSFVYGASLTSIDDHRAIRFGGFQAGGYSQETNQVALLTLKDQEKEDGTKELAAEWKVIPTQNPQFGASSRAYHTATLVGGRYVVIVGGMMWRESILREAILDTHTWTWIEQSITSDVVNDKPSGRHGHSVVFDSRRNRLVLFGGGSGTDLLRSGQDNAEVWELNMGGDSWKTDLAQSLPWQWRKIHSDANATNELNDEEDTDSDDIEETKTDSQGQGSSTPQISSVESLCLGRCHHGIRVSLDTVLFVFGSGRPSTNGVLAFDLRTDTFLHPRVQGLLPRPRFTGVAAFLEADGYLFVHGGYTSQEGEAIGDMSVLDLAPSLNRIFNRLPVDTSWRSYREITDQEAQQGLQNRDSVLQSMLQNLTAAPEDERQVMAANMLGQMIANGGIGSRAFLLMNMIASGSAVVRDAFSDNGDDNDDDDDDDSDSDYQEGGNDEI
jgi:hypothetical protein